MIEKSKPKGLLVRVGIDQTYGRWNAPCREDGSFCYIPMRPLEQENFDKGFETTYDKFEQDYQLFAGQESKFPNRLQQKTCHLDPDYRFTTYGDAGKMGNLATWRRTKRIKDFFDGSSDNFIVFYASFKPMGGNQKELVYAIMGFYHFQKVYSANQVPFDRRDENAHTRLADYQLGTNESIVIFADKNKSGRLKYLINIGEKCKNKQYYVQEKLLNEWGGISSKKGWIQRCVHPPHFCKPEKFLEWFYAQEPEFIHENNIRY